MIKYLEANYNFTKIYYVQSGSIFIEWVGIVVGSVLIPLLETTERVLEEIVFEAEMILVIPPPRDDDADDWLTSMARKLFNCVIRLAFCF
jgi:hypothetical protein